MVDDSRTRFYLDPARGKWKGVCAGIADYVGIDVTWIRFGAIALTLAGGFPWTLIAYGVFAWSTPNRPAGLYVDADEARFWQGVRTNTKRSAQEIRSSFRDIDRRLADIESYYVSKNTQLSDEIERLR